MFNKFFLTSSVLITLVVLGVGAYSLVRSNVPTSIDQSNVATFRGLSAVKAPIHNVVVVHGIGTHCIGYADELIGRTVKLLAGDAHLKTGEAIVADSRSWDPYCSESSDGVYQMSLQSSVEAQERKCRTIYWARRSNAASTEDCYVLYVRKFNYQRTSQNSSEESSVKSSDNHSDQYQTGFVRVREFPLSEQQTARFFEITWSPAARWVKNSLQGVQAFNESKSRAEFNVKLKEGLVDSAIADAVAYLGKSGVLVNHDLLQAFCLITAMGSSSRNEVPLPPLYSCSADHLKNARDFAENNAVSFISHSLGTRVLLDTLGLLSFGIESSPKQSAVAVKALVSQVRRTVDIIDAKIGRLPNTVEIGNGQRESISALENLIDELKCHVKPGVGRSDQSEPGQCRKGDDRVVNKLPLEMERRFVAIGAAAGDSTFLEELAIKKGGQSPLSEGIRAFIESIESVYIFTNQIPLLYSHIGSPFIDADRNFSEGLSGFLGARAKAREQGVPKRPPLQIVSFHDPDDLLSYNLKCWFHLAILKGDDLVKDAIFSQAESDASRRIQAGKIEPRCASSKTPEELHGCMTGWEAYRIRKQMFGESCFEEDFEALAKSRSDLDPDWYKLYLKLWETQPEIELIDVNVLMSAKGGPKFVWPEDVHSNYFKDDEVMRYLACGSGGCNEERVN